MVTEKLQINNRPALYIQSGNEKVMLFLHGKHGCKEEAISLAELFLEAGWDVLALDLPEHGDRADKADKKDCLPWVVIPEWKEAVRWLEERYRPENIGLYAVSISAWFVMRTFRERIFDRALFVSPIVDMRRVIEDMMDRAGVTASDLGWKQRIPTTEGETLIWDYYAYAAYQPINCWNTPTYILRGTGDALQDDGVIGRFAGKFHADVTTIPGEHWLHTTDEVATLRLWLRERLV